MHRFIIFFICIITYNLHSGQIHCGDPPPARFRHTQVVSCYLCYSALIIIRILNISNCPLYFIHNISQMDSVSPFRWCVVNWAQSTELVPTRKTERRMVYHSIKCIHLFYIFEPIHPMLGGFPCHNGMARPRVADGRDGLQLEVSCEYIE
jgi:hypothetical protein